MTMIMSELTHHPIFTYAPQCEWYIKEVGDDDCEHAAKWTMRTSCCGDIWLMCDEHKDKTLDIHANMKVPVHNGPGACHKPMVNIIVEAL